MKVLPIVLALSFAVAQARNPASFLCEDHYQTFVKQGSISRNGRCFDVYTHARPAHRVELPCR